jgi:peptidoglycan/LPS O-acetylase OafA/YrhL
MLAFKKVNEVPSISSPKSEFLDFLRWTAALIVVIGHVDMVMGMFFTETTQHSIFGYSSLHAHTAVMVFFVLSGYVVSYASEKKSFVQEYSFRKYYLDRWSRIFSVLTIAILCTLILDFVGGLFSQIYKEPEFIPQDSFYTRLFANVFALQGFQGFRMQLGSNSALWSIGYEFTYYIIFGLLYFRPKLFGLSRLWLLAAIIILLVAGTNIILYFSIWLLGALAYKLSKLKAVSKIRLNSWLCILILILVNHYLNIEKIFSTNEFVNDFIFSFVFALLLIFDMKGKYERHLGQANKFMASFSYSLYAVHMPFIFLCLALIAPSINSEDHFYLGILILFGSIVFAKIIFYLGENHRLAWRATFNRLLQRIGI